MKFYLKEEYLDNIYAINVCQNIPKKLILKINIPMSNYHLFMKNLKEREMLQMLKKE